MWWQNTCMKQVEKKENSESKIDYNGDKFISVENNIKYWWNLSVKTLAKI